MNYDYGFKRGNIDYGVIKGNNKLVFIKLGLGGSCLECEDKYIIIGRRLHDVYGCSVIVASNPEDVRNQFLSDREAIEQYASENLLDLPELYFFGNSNGGIKGLELTADGVEFKKMVLINMPLMINFHKTKAYISKIPQTEIVAVYGEKDPSFRYTPFLDGVFNNVKVLTVPNADHNFKDMSDDFVALSDFLMI